MEGEGLLHALADGVGAVLMLGTALADGEPNIDALAESVAVGVVTALGVPLKKDDSDCKDVGD